MAKIYKLLVLNRSDSKSTVSFNIRTPVNEELYNHVSQHHKRKLVSQTIPVVIPMNQSKDICEITGMSPSQIRGDFEFNIALRKSNDLRILEEVEYEDPEGFYPVRS